MKTSLFIFSVMFSISNAFCQSSWHRVEGKISTPWADQVDPANPLPEYPRPQMVRAGWMNLNGLWDYSISPAQIDAMPASADGKILVPFAIESSLSGVGKEVGKDRLLWYRRTFVVPSSYKNKISLLHFGAIDWACDVFVNGKKAGSHQGGYDPFTFDVTSLLSKSGNQQVVIKVWDPTDDGPQPRGKQVKNPHSIWYTPVTGIWQTVWIEAVPQTYIESIKLIPEIGTQTVSVEVAEKNFLAGDLVRISVWDGERKISEKTGPGDVFELPVPGMKLWSPQNPFLYDFKVEILRKSKVVDMVKSYFGMRKISMAPDKNGMQRLLLNNEVVFQYGPLDQGWWPDGLYTAPTDDALRFDIEKTKEMGFNMIRKHVKVEPARWYYQCDRLGMLVWQDMPSGDLGNRWEPRPGIIGTATDKARTPESEQIYKTEWKAIMDANYNSPSIVMWVPFNEGWGQFKTEEITRWTMEMDPTRLVNCASGGNFSPAGHIFDLHNYPDPAMPDPALFGGKQVIVLGEFGGLGLPVEGHTWQQKDNWGYQSFKSFEELTAKYVSFIDRLPNLIAQGLAAAIYTQTTDVEIETNGLMTYDRAVVKMPVQTLVKAHNQLYK